MKEFKGRTSSGKAPWVLVLILAVIVTSGIGIARCVRQSSVPQDVAKLAHDTGRDPQTYYDLKQLIKHADSNQAISEADYNKTLTLFQSYNVSDKEDALRVFTFVADGPHHSDILALARKLIDDPSGPVQMQALRLLWICHAPEWKSEATQRLTSPLEEVQQTAESVLNKGEFVRKAWKP